MPAYNPNLQPDNSILTNLRVSGRAAAPVQVTAPNRTTFVKGLGDAMMDAEAMKLRMPTEVERAKQMEINRLAAANDPSLVEGRLQADLNKARAMARLNNREQMRLYRDQEFERELERKKRLAQAESEIWYQNQGLRASQMDEEIAYKQKMLGTISATELQNDINRYRSDLPELELQQYLKKFGATNKADLENKIRILDVELNNQIRLATDPGVQAARDEAADKQTERDIKRQRALGEIQIDLLAQELDVRGAHNIRQQKKEISEIYPLLDKREIKNLVDRIRATGDANIEVQIKSLDQLEGRKLKVAQKRFEQDLRNKITEFKELAPLRRKEQMATLKEQLGITNDMSHEAAMQKLNEYIPAAKEKERQLYIDTMRDADYQAALSVYRQIQRDEGSLDTQSQAEAQAKGFLSDKVGEARKVLEQEQEHRANKQLITSLQQMGYEAGDYNPANFDSTKGALQGLIKQVGAENRETRSEAKQARATARTIAQQDRADQLRQNQRAEAILNRIVSESSLRIGEFSKTAERQKQVARVQLADNITELNKRLTEIDQAVLLFQSKEESLRQGFMKQFGRVYNPDPSNSPSSYRTTEYPDLPPAEPRNNPPPPINRVTPQVPTTPPVSTGGASQTGGRKLLKIRFE